LEANTRYVRQASTSEEINETSFGEDSKSQ